VPHHEYLYGAQLPHRHVQIEIAEHATDGRLEVALKFLLTDACDSLMQGFHGAAQRLDQALGGGGVRDDDAALRETLRVLYGAVTALQFQDMASQLVAHTTRRLRNCADRIARDTMGDDEDGETLIEEAPLRPNPVTQDEMDAGSIELF